MLIAVTGATGFLGRYIVNHLLEHGHSCRCWFRPSSRRDGFVDGLGSISWQAGTLNDPAATSSLVAGVDAVVHSALNHHGRWGPQSGGLLPFVEANVLGSLRLIESARDMGVQRFIFISTCAVHEKILDDRPLDEAHPLWPTSHYGAHKAAIEKFVHSYGLPNRKQPTGWDICALRPTGIYGLATPADQSRWYRLVRDVVQGLPIDVATGGKEVHAADVAKAVQLLLDTQPGTTAGQSYNCYDQYIATETVAQIAKEKSASPSPITEHRPNPKHQIDTSKLRSLGMTFGSQPLLEQTVQQLVDAVRATA